MRAKKALSLIIVAAMIFAVALPAGVINAAVSVYDTTTDISVQSDRNYDDGKQGGYITVEAYMRHSWEDKVKQAKFWVQNSKGDAPTYEAETVFSDDRQYLNPVTIKSMGGPATRIHGYAQVVYFDITVHTEDGYNFVGFYNTHQYDTYGTIGRNGMYEIKPTNMGNNTYRFTTDMYSPIDPYSGLKFESHDPSDYVYLTLQLQVIFEKIVPQSIEVLPPVTVPAPAPPAADSGLTLKVNGETIDTGDTPPFIADGRTMVPVRFISEALGAEVKWDANTRLVTITAPDKVITLTVGDKTLYVNGEAVQMDAAATIVNGRTFVPVKFIAEALGMTVGWDPDSKTVSLNE